MLHQGRMELEGAKATVEGVLEDVKALKGLWAWLVGLFRKPETKPKPVAKKAIKAKQQSYEELELKLIADVGKNLGILFDTQAAINAHYAELEEESKTNYDPTQNTSKKAIERALVELQMEKLQQQVRESMVYAPAELKDLYSRFLKMYKKIEQEQEWARSEMVRKARFARQKKELEEVALIEIVCAVMGVVFVSTVFGWLMWQLRNLSGGF